MLPIILALDPCYFRYVIITQYHDWGQPGSLCVNLTAFAWGYWGPGKRFVDAWTKTSQSFFSNFSLLIWKAGCVWKQLKHRGWKMAKYSSSSRNYDSSENDINGNYCRMQERSSICICHQEAQLGQVVIFNENCSCCNVPATALNNMAVWAKQSKAKHWFTSSCIVSIQYDNLHDTVKYQYLYTFMLVWYNCCCLSLYLRKKNCAELACNFT